jgi:lysozyme
MSEDPALQIAVPLIARFEGFRSKVYQDQKGVWTIGYGSTYLLDGRYVTVNTSPISEPDARAMMTTVVARTLADVRAMCHVPITDNQAAALTSFAYNFGVPRTRSSTLIKKLNAGDVQGAADQFAGWCHLGAVVDPGLVRRRREERDLFLSNATPAASDALKQPGVILPSSTPEEVLTADDLNAQVLKGLHNV